VEASLQDLIMPFDLHKNIIYIFLCDVSFFHIYTELIEIQREIGLGLYNHKFLFREDDDWKTIKIL
jgi:hypothetical protein